MYSRKVYPSIEANLVRRALSDLRHLSREQTHSPLEHLLLVDLIILDIDSPHSPNQRMFALQHLLVSIITELLTAHRVKSGLPQPQEADSFQSAQSAVTLDGRNGNLDLLGCSWLYYFYVRTDLNFTQELFARLVGVDARSVRRYQQYAISHLTECLIQREWQARTIHRRRHMQTRLPAARPRRLIGREAEFAHAHYSFDQLEWNHLQVVGERGVGKTVFVQEFLRQRIEMEVFDAMVWIDKPRSVEAVRAQLTDHFKLEGRRAALREFLAKHRMGLVLDGAEHLQDELETFRLLLDDLSEAVVIIIHHARLALDHVPSCIYLRELEQRHALTLIRTLAEAQFRGSQESWSEDEVWYVWQRAKGNPGAIHAGVHAVQCVFVP